MVRALRLRPTLSASASRSKAGRMAASVLMTQIIVATRGLIMPLPLAMAPMRHGFPSRTNFTTKCFGRVSVVMMA